MSDHNSWTPGHIYLKSWTTGMFSDWLKIFKKVKCVDHSKQSRVSKVINKYFSSFNPLLKYVTVNLCILASIWKCSLASCNPSTIQLWNLATIKLWNLATIQLWNLATIQLYTLVTFLHNATLEHFYHVTLQPFNDATWQPFNFIQL